MRRALLCLVTGLMLLAGSVQSARAQQPDSLLNRAYAHLAAQRVDSAIVEFEAALQLNPALVPARADLAYALLRAGRLDEAIRHLRLVAAANPTDAQIRKELGYALVRARRFELALAEFIEATRLDPADGAAWLQRGYLHAHVRNRRAAREAYIKASEAGTPEVAARAERELEALGAAYARAGVWFAELYAAPLYVDRFDDLIVTGQLRIGRIVAGAPHTEVYASLRATRDTRSVGGALPRIFSDNAIVPAVGVRLSPVQSVALLLEAGFAIPLLDERDVEADIRAGAFLSQSWAPARIGRVGDLYADVIYYSRFDHNVISNVQYRDGLRLSLGDAFAFDVYARGALIADTDRDPGNNLIEGGAGVRLAWNRSTGNWLGAELVRGRYLRGGFNDRNYSDFRIMLIVSRFEMFGRKQGRPR